jgi:hypothetical protein
MFKKTQNFSLSGKKTQNFSLSGKKCKIFPYRQKIPIFSIIFPTFYEDHLRSLMWLKWKNYASERLFSTPDHWSNYRCSKNLRTRLSTDNVVFGCSGFRIPCSVFEKWIPYSVFRILKFHSAHPCICACMACSSQLFRSFSNTSSFNLSDRGHRLPKNFLLKHTCLRATEVLRKCTEAAEDHGALCIIHISIICCCLFCRVVNICSYNFYSFSEWCFHTGFFIIYHIDLSLCLCVTCNTPLPKSWRENNGQSQHCAAAQQQNAGSSISKRVV